MFECTTVLYVVCQGGVAKLTEKMFVEDCPIQENMTLFYIVKGSSQNVSFFQMKLVSFGSDHPPTPSKWKCEKQITDVL